MSAIQFVGIVLILDAVFFASFAFIGIGIEIGYYNTNGTPMTRGGAFRSILFVLFMAALNTAAVVYSIFLVKP